MTGSIRSPLARALGLGSAKEGVEHWWIVRVTAVSLIPLSVWLIAALVSLAGSDYDGVVAWLRMPHATILLVLLLTALFYHMALGLQVVVEDYVHSGAKFAVVILLRLGCSALAVAGILATLRVAFSG